MYKLINLTFSSLGFLPQETNSTTLDQPIV